MKQILVIIFTLFLTTGISACRHDDDSIPEIPETEQPNDENDNQGDTEKMKFMVKVGLVSFVATMTDNETAKTFKALLPMTINMSDYNDNEKLYYLPNNLPTASFNPKTISSGDIMLFGSNCLVLFYKTFSTSYSYTKIGNIEDASGLEKALGTGNIIVVFEETED